MSDLRCFGGWRCLSVMSDRMKDDWGGRKGRKSTKSGRAGSKASISHKMEESSLVKCSSSGCRRINS